MNSNSGGVRHDYKNPLRDPQPADAVAGLRLTAMRLMRRQRQSAWLWFAAGIAIPLLMLVLLNGHETDTPNAQRAPERAAQAAPAATAETETPPQDTAPAQAAQSEPVGGILPDVGPELTDEVVLRVGPGDSLDALFSRNKLDRGDLALMLREPQARSALSLVKPGDEIRVWHRSGRVERLERDLDDFRLLRIQRSGEQFTSATLTRKVEVRRVAAHGRIRSSLFAAGQQAGMTDQLIMNMAGIFQWDVDFVQDVRPGDEFSVLYQQLWRDGEMVGNGDIVAAEFVNRGRRYRAVRFEGAGGRTDYYTPDGHNVRKAFIRAPVDFTRISSVFTTGRKHPILNKIRAHKGVDYAAPAGTPIKAAGDGKIIKRGKNGGYGNVVVLQHGGNITTLYAHMSRFARGQHVGSWVHQGDVIGYVGQTGLATGPHLHYEYRINGVHRNPRTVPLPPADPVPQDLRAKFQASTAPLLEALAEIDETRVASLDAG